MAQQTINLGSAPDDGTGDTLRVGGDKINDNFTELYTDKADKAGGTFTGDIIVPADAYDATTWNGNNEVPTKDAIRDKIESLGASGLTIEDEGVSEATGVTTLNFTGSGVTATDIGGGEVQVDIAGAAGYTDEQARDAIGAALVEGAGVDITVDDGADTITIASGVWRLAGSGQTATGVYDFAVDGAKANIDFTGLGSFNELLIIARGLSNGTNGNRILRVSVDNGSTFYSSSGDYISIDVNGVETNDTALAAHSSSSTAARSVIANITNTKGAAKLCQMQASSNSQRLFVASASDINAIRVTNSGGGNMTAGTVRVFAR